MGSWWHGRPLAWDRARTELDAYHDRCRDEAVRRRNRQLEAIAEMELELASSSYEAAREAFVRTGNVADLDRMLSYVRAAQ